MPDVHSLQGPRVHEGRQVQGSHHAAELEAHAVHAGAGRVFPLRELPEAGVFTLQTVKDEGGLFERAAQQQQPTGPPLEVHRLFKPAVRGPEVQNMFYLPRRGVQRQEEELQRLRSGAKSEANAEVVGRCEFFLVIQLQFRYLPGQERRRSHLRQGGAQEESRSIEREKKCIHLRRLPDGREDKEVAGRRHHPEMRHSRAAEWPIALFCCLD